jgi:hypothetical protein
MGVAFWAAAPEPGASQIRQSAAAIPARPIRDRAIAVSFRAGRAISGIRLPIRRSRERIPRGRIR